MMQNGIIVTVVIKIRIIMIIIVTTIRMARKLAIAAPCPIDQLVTLTSAGCSDLNWPSL